ncbi:hypothetical protein ACFXJ8_17200 [Nonomuraea sp. NPDC059194]|uniref:hypothetical protein n=1 Tax=Nonomuraea sp. NPDC059194 TaxID=3346764 RepID=UPI0036A458C2
MTSSAPPLTGAPKAGEGLTAAFLAALSEPVPAPFKMRRYLPMPAPYGPAEGTVPAEGLVPADPWAERGIDVDQTNHSVVVGERIVVKWLAEPATLPHPTLAAFAHLTETGFAHTAPPYAALTRVEPSGAETLLALVTGYLPEARDGWEWCVDEAEAGRTGFAATLGRLAADLHLALATFPSPEGAPSGSGESAPSGSGESAPSGSEAGAPVGGRSELGRAVEALREALALTDGEDGAWLRAREPVLRAALAPLASPVTTPRIRIHGDFHVGQILQWRDGYAVIDFDGNPTVADADPYQPAARDVAQLTTSLEHVAQVAIRRRDADASAAAAWAAAARADLLAAYRLRLAEAGRPDLLDERLLGPFEIEQECRELIYAARHLPRWRYAPMGVLRTRFTEENP